MNNILLVSHKEINLNPVFRQEQNVLELYNILKDNNNTEILYLHKIFDSNKDEENSISNIKQFSIRDIITKDLNGKQVKNFLKEHNINTIIFTSYHVAKIIMPYIESVIFDLNIICDFRLSNISYTLKEYKEEKDKDSYRLKEIKKDFKQQLIKLFVVFKYTDYIILDDYEDIEMLNDDNIKNKVITINNINDFINVKSTKKKIYYTVTNIVINKNNFLSNSISGNIKKTRDDEYIINNTKNLELINSLNEIIMNTKSDCFCIYNDKINISKSTINMLADYLMCNDKLAFLTPITIYSKEVNFLQTQFENQRNNNFSNWEEVSLSSFFECVIIKRNILKKIGVFDNHFKSFEYAIFDFILKLHQVGLYYCRVNDISVFKTVNISHPISLFKEDKTYLCNKWGEKNLMW